MELLPRVRELLIEAAKRYREAFAFCDEALAAWHNHLGANPPRKPHRQPGATREEREEKAAAEAERWLKERTRSIVADSTRRNAHLLLNTVYGNLGITNEDIEGGKLKVVEVEERVCQACTKRFPVEELYLVRFKDAPDEPVILCGECYGKEQAEGRETASLKTLEQARPQPPAEGTDDKAPEIIHPPVGGEAEVLAAAPLKPDFIPPDPQDKGLKPLAPEGETEEGDDA